MTLGEYICEARGEMSQAHLAERVREKGPPASQQLVSFWEGDKIIPRADQMEAIAAALPNASLERLHELAADAEARRRRVPADSSAA